MLPGQAPASVLAASQPGMIMGAAQLAPRATGITGPASNDGHVSSSPYNTANIVQHVYPPLPAPLSCRAVSPTAATSTFSPHLPPP
jgi:hypothetical protein